jgi:hypothetical protein
MSNFTQMADEWIRQRHVQATPSRRLLRQPPHTLEAWREPFGRWLDYACVRHPRGFGGVSCLHIAFCEWAIAHDDVPCTRETFESLLAEWGLLIADGMVSWLILKEDIEKWGCY